MADHVRKQIRAAVASAVTGLATTGARVFTSRTAPLPQDTTNALRVYCKDETEIRAAATGAGAARVRLDRTVEIVIEAVVKKASGFDDELDQILKEVEVAMSAVQSAGGAKRIHPVRLETDYEGDGEQELAVGRLVYEGFYFTALNAPDVAL